MKPPSVVDCIKTAAKVAERTEGDVSERMGAFWKALAKAELWAYEMSQSLWHEAGKKRLTREERRALSYLADDWGQLDIQLCYARRTIHHSMLIFNYS